MKSFMLIFFIRACLCTYDEDYYESEDDISDKKGFASSDITENIDLFDSATDMIVTDSTTTVPPHLTTSFTTSTITVWPKRITSFSTPTTTTVWPNRTTSCSTPSHNTTTTDTTTTDTTTTDTTTDTTTEIGRIDFY